MSLSALACRLSDVRIFFLVMIFKANSLPSSFDSAKRTRPNAPRPNSLRNLKLDSFVNGVFGLLITVKSFASLACSSFFLELFEPYITFRKWSQNDFLSLFAGGSPSSCALAPLSPFTASAISSCCSFVAIIGVASTPPRSSNVSKSKSGSFSPMTNCSPVSKFFIVSISTSGISSSTALFTVACSWSIFSSLDLKSTSVRSGLVSTISELGSGKGGTLPIGATPEEGGLSGNGESCEPVSIGSLLCTVSAWMYGQG